jgi:hypothetical protein
MATQDNYSLVQVSNMTSSVTTKKFLIFLFRRSEDFGFKKVYLETSDVDVPMS